MSAHEKRTMIKVPCGGFKLDNNFLGMNENDELSLTGGGDGNAYQQLVTDGEGGAKWEDRLAYDDSKLVVDFEPFGCQFVKVADEVPFWTTVDSPMKVWMNNGMSATVTPEEYTDLDKGNFLLGNMMLFTMTDNTEVFGVVFSEKGVYFAYGSNVGYVTGIASADSDMPEITWDGSLGVIKKLDEKFIPDIPVEKLPDIPVEKLPDIPAHVIEVNGDFFNSIENASQPLYSVKNLNYSEILSIFNSKNFVIKDNVAYYRPINFSISTAGVLFVQILVNRISASGNMVVAQLACSNGNSSFYRNTYWTIAGTKR